MIPDIDRKPLKMLGYRRLCLRFASGVKLKRKADVGINMALQAGEHTIACLGLPGLMGVATASSHCSDEFSQGFVR